MKWRAEWNPKPISSSELKDIEQEIMRIEEKLANAETEAAEESVRAFNAIRGRNEPVSVFRDYGGAMSRTELALRMSQPEPVRSENVTRAELIELIRRVQDPEYAADALIDREAEKAEVSGFAGGSGENEADLAQVSAEDRTAFLQEFYLERLTANVCMPDVSDLIFWGDLEAEEIADRVLAYAPTELPPSHGRSAMRNRIGIPQGR
ncbi:hypothetical protein [Saccharibacillus endophyticus]|uniref:Uncharacterized protein n=1 Tax=Saccharibacillus endophyticus TaxID=2060666 RepID=A0ABQ1ZX52_9BACL|nr:hypothetical protein [Saccharibacillus endophyticus]GGH79429.1 hypothetical protein GCM10007362_26210 [Saccharibacillus endophyticus]